MALFDYGTMIIFNFEGSTEAELLSTNKIHGLAVLERSTMQGELTIREALFLLIQQGYERIMERRRREGSWTKQLDGDGTTYFQLQAMNGSPSMLTYWREIAHGGQQMFQNMGDGSVRPQPPTSAYSAFSRRNAY